MARRQGKPIGLPKSGGRTATSVQGPPKLLPMTVSEKIDDRARIKATYKLLPLDYLMQVLNQEPIAPELPTDDPALSAEDNRKRYAEYVRDYAKYYAAQQDVRMQAAQAAAPYLHARLTAIEVKQDAPFVQEVRFTVIEGIAREKIEDDIVRLRVQ